MISVDFRAGRSAARDGRALWQRLRRWMTVAQFGFPFAVGPFPTPVSRFRALARRARFVERATATRHAIRLMMTLMWPLGAFSTAVREWLRLRARGTAAQGARVLLHMYWLALRHSIPPLEYARYRLYDPARRADLHDYVYWNDLPGLAALNARAGADNRDVQDKDRFASICASAGLPHVETLAVFAGGRQTYPTLPFAPDVPLLWSKALSLKGGAGGTKWTRDRGSYCDATGRRVTASQLADVLRLENCIVQPFLDNHPAVARLTNGALASLRIVTGMDLNGEAQLVTSLMALPHGARSTSVAGILCSVSPTSGQIRRAAMPNGEPIERHPDTGEQITGAILPFWPESMALARHAHATAFSRFPFLGWDLALTPDGAVLLETNSGWGALFHQQLDGPLGHTAFSRLVDGHLSRLSCA